MGKIRIMHVIYSLEIGGAEADLVQKLNHLSGEFEFMVVTLARRGEFCDRIPGVRVVNLGMKSKLDIRVVMRFYILLFSFRPHIVHSHLFNAGFLARLLSLPLPVTSIATVQMIRPDRPAWQKAADFLLQFSTQRIIAASGAIRDQLVSEGVSSSRISVIYNSVDLERFRNPGPAEESLAPGLPEKAIVIGTLCRLDRDKGLDYLIGAAKLLEHRKDLYFIIAGYGREEQSLKDLVRDLDLLDRVFFPGKSDRPEKVYPLFDIYVLPSRTEGLGITLIEAMACGCPVIGSETGGIPEVVDHLENGLLFERGNIADLASKIELLADDRALCEKLSQKAAASSARFEPESLSHMLASLYRKALSSRKRRRDA